jgi:hypothetical protein
MADQPYTEADVERVAEALKASNVKRWETGEPVPAWCGLATAALDALAAAGRLLAEGAKVDVMLPDGTHTYWSTHCRHGNHQLCESNAITGLTVVSERPVAIGKVPARCKSCASPCVCECHASPDGGYGFMDRLNAQDQGSTDE